MIKKIGKHQSGYISNDRLSDELNGLVELIEEIDSKLNGFFQVQDSITEEQIHNLIPELKEYRSCIIRYQNA